MACGEAKKAGGESKKGNSNAGGRVKGRRLRERLDWEFPTRRMRTLENGTLSIVVAAVLSGNRNFEGCGSCAFTRANYLASPPLVVAYALAGTVYMLTLTLTKNKFQQVLPGCVQCIIGHGA